MITSLVIPAKILLLILDSLPNFLYITLTSYIAGDLGYLDEEGFLFIKGRIKRMITRFDGHKVFPVNLEGMIMRHEGVKNCAVVGVRDRAHSMGHYPIALVEANPDVEDPKALCRELFDICNKEAEERGRPVAVMPIDAIPLSLFLYYKIMFRFKKELIY